MTEFLVFPQPVQPVGFDFDLNEKQKSEASVLVAESL
jgi:hypothetical protein